MLIKQLGCVLKDISCRTKVRDFTDEDYELWVSVTKHLACQKKLNKDLETHKLPDEIWWKPVTDKSLESIGYVVMRSDLSTVLSDNNGWIVYTKEKARTVAKNFSGVVKTLKVAKLIINK